MGLCAEEPFSVDYVLRLPGCVNAPELRLAPVSCWGRNVSVVDSGSPSRQNAATDILFDRRLWGARRGVFRVFDFS